MLDKRRNRTYIIGIFLCALPTFFLFDPELRTARIMFPGQQILSQESTPYGHLVVTKSENQVTVFSNGIVVGSTENIIAAEESIHYGLSQHPNPEKVLLIWCLTLGRKPLTSLISYMSNVSIRNSLSD